MSTLTIFDRFGRPIDRTEINPSLGGGMSKPVRRTVADGRKFIAQCTPSRGMVSMQWVRNIQSVLMPNNTGKALFYLRDKVGGEIAEVRNGIVDLVLKYDAEANPVSNLFWVDDDVLVFPGCLLQLLHHDVDICSGVYFQKLEGDLTSPLIYPARHGGADKFIPDRFYPVWGHGMGLTLVKTDVYRRMRDELDLPKDKYGRTQWYHTTITHGTDEDDVLYQDEHGCIDTGFTEDLYFLDNAAKLGYQPYIDTTKHAFGFHFDAANDQGYPTEQWRQWTNGECIVWDTPDGKVTWD